MNRLQTVTDAYNKVISRRVYDANGNIIKEIDAEGYQSAGDDEARYGTIYTYNLANLIVSYSTPEAVKKKKISMKYTYNQYGEVIKQTDGMDSTISYEYDAAGNLIKVTDALGTATKYSYDKQGNKLTMTDGRGKLTRYTYAAFGNLRSVINADNQTQICKYDLEGNTACVTDKNGNNTLYTYDNRGLLLQRKVTETGDSISYGYDEAGNRISMADESGSSTYCYDENNRLTGIQKGGITKNTEDFLNEVKKKGTQEQLNSLLKGLNNTGKLTITVNEKFDKYEIKNKETGITEPNAEIRISNEKEFVEISKSWREKHGGNYTTWDEAKAVYAVYDAGFRESDFASYSDYEKAVFEANAKIADEKFGMKPEEFLAVMMGIIIEKGISVKGSYSAFEEESVIYTKNKAAFVEAETIQVPGSVQSRINISNNGWSHVLKEHFSTKNKSQFTISQRELKTLLQNKDIIKTPVTRTLDSADGIRYVREIDVGKNIGNDKFNNFQPTTKMTILTDKYGNLITATPGVIK